MKPKKVTSRKGMKIQHTTCSATNEPLFKVYTKEEWSYGEGFRCCEWEATSIEEAHQFIDGFEGEK